MATALMGSHVGSFASIGTSQVHKSNMEAVSVAPSVFRPIESSAFLGERVACAPSSSVPHGASLSVKRGPVARSFTGPEQGASGRIIMTPFGPMFAPGGRGSWELNRNRVQEERARIQRAMAQRARLRAMIEQQLRNGIGVSGERNAELLRELERRLRAKATEQSDPAIDELMKQLEQRLRPETKDSDNDMKSSADNSKKQEYSTVYDYLNAWLKEWDQGMREERERLQKLWEKSNEQPESEAKPNDSSTASEPNNSSSAAEKWDRVFTPEELHRSESKEEEKKPDEKPSGRDEPLSDGTVVHLKNEANGAEMYLVGTSHISKQSADEVRAVIQKVKPDYVMVELDRKRYNSMMQRSQGGSNNPFEFLQQIGKTLANGDIGAAGKLMGLGLSGFYRLLSTRGLQSGQEMKAAIEEGKKVGATVVLGDQDIDVTLKRFGELMSMNDALQYFFRPVPPHLARKIMGGAATTEQLYERMRDRKVVREFNKVLDLEAPTITRVLLDERNEVMTKALRKLSGKVVAVVGLAHMDGIEQLWREANEKHVDESTQ